MTASSVGYLLCYAIAYIAVLTQVLHVQVHYDRSSKQSEQTAEENQQLLASNDELKEKVQELDKASQALQVSLFKEWIALFIAVLHVWHFSPQEKLSAKQELLDEQQREITAVRAQLSSRQVRYVTRKCYFFHSISHSLSTDSFTLVNTQL